MRYRKLGASDMEVSVVSLGTWVMGGDQWGKADDAQSIAAIQTAIDLGINLIDTAAIYGVGHAEEVVGKAIKGRRERVFVATKCGVHKRGARVEIDLNPWEIRKELENSLSRMAVEQIDLYQIHWPDLKTPLEDTLEEMLAMQREGKIRYIGVSNFDRPLLEKAVGVAPLMSVQPHYSLLEQEIAKDVLPFCRERNIGVMTYGSLGSGILSGKYMKQPTFGKSDARRFFYPFYREPLWGLSQQLVKELKEIARERGKPLAQLVLNWTIQQSGVTTAIAGARSPEQVVMNAGVGEWELSGDELSSIDKAYGRIFGGEAKMAVRTYVKDKK